jgi:hypothetical protein
MVVVGVSPTVGRSIEEFVDLGSGIELRLSSSMVAWLAGIGPWVPALLREGGGRILDVTVLATDLRPHQMGVRSKWVGADRSSAYLTGGALGGA